MEVLFCPYCYCTEFTEDFSCRECQTSFLTGEKRTLKQQKRSLELRNHLISVSTQKVVRKNSGRKFVAAASVFVVLFFLVGIAFQQSYFGKTKSLETVAAQLSAHNDLNKFAIETNDQKTLTAITLTQENVKVSADNNSPLIIKMLFDCVIDQDFLNRTPDEYHITIMAKDIDFKEFTPARLQFQTEKEALNIEKRADNNSPEYVSFKISRKQLETIAAAAQINFQTGKYRGQMNFAQQQSLKSFLIATSLDSTLN